MAIVISLKKKFQYVFFYIYFWGFRFWWFQLNFLFDLFLNSICHVHVFKKKVISADSHKILYMKDQNK